MKASPIMKLMCAQTKKEKKRECKFDIQNSLNFFQFRKGRLKLVFSPL